MPLTCTWPSASQSGNWSDTTKWTNCNSEYPGQNSANVYTVVIADLGTTNRTVTLNILPPNPIASLTMSGQNADTSLVFLNSLTATGTVTINNGIGANDDAVVSVGTSTFNIGGNLVYVMGATNAGRTGVLTVSTGEIIVNGQIDFGTVSTRPGNLVLEVSSTGTSTVKGNFVNFANGTVSLAAGSNFNYNGTLGQTVVAASYSNLYISNTNASGATTSAATTVGGALTVAPSGKFNVLGFNLTVTGATVVGGTLAHQSTTGTKTFNGAVTINSGGSWTNTSNEDITFAAGLTNNSGGTLTMGSGVQTFGGNQTINGSNSISFGGNVTIGTNNTVTNDNLGVVSIAGTLSGSNNGSTWTQGANSYLLALSGSVILPGNGNLNPSGSGNTVEFAGTNQDMTANNQLAGSYYNLLISGSNNTSPTLTVTNVLTVSGISWTPSSGTVTLSGTATPFVVSGTYTPSGTQTMNFTGSGATVTCTGYQNLGLLPGDSTAQTICTGTSQTLTVGGDLTVGNGSNAGATATANDPTITVTGSVTIANGAEFTSTSGNLSIGGNFTNNGTFTHANGIVIFTGAVSHTINGSSSTTFYSFSDTVAGSSLLFANNGGGGTPLYTFATGGTVTITGAEGNLITITSNNQPTNSWTVHFDDAQSGITYVTVSYSACDVTSATVTLGSDSVDGAPGGTNGACWDFGGGGVPTVITNDASGISALSASLNGNIDNTGGSDVTVRGFAWGTDSTLSTVFATTTDTVGQPFGTGPFGKGVSGLFAGTTYYFRAYATNITGDGFGIIKSFTPATCGTGSSVTFFHIGGGQCRAFLTAGTSMTLPTNWNNNNNTIEVIGGGGGGAGGKGASINATGGGGGAYSATTSLSLTPGGSVTYQVGSGGSGLADANGTAGGDTIFNGTGTTCDAAQTNEVCAKGGQGGLRVSGSSGSGGAGGDASSGVGVTKNSGGRGGDYSSGVDETATGGGGAAGPFGAGNPGVDSTTDAATAGGSGDAGNGGGGGAGLKQTGTGTGGAGGAGTEWSSAGSGGGAGGMTCTTIGCTANGGVGGNYGGGGGAGNGPGTGSDVGGNGKQGVIVITYALEDNPFTPVRTLRLFEGFSIKFFSGKIIVYPQ